MRGLRGTLCVIALSLVILGSVLFLDSTHMLREQFASGRSGTTEITPLMIVGFVILAIVGFIFVGFILPRL